jgi:hypothetical protein
MNLEILQNSLLSLSNNLRNISSSNHNFTSGLTSVQKLVNKSGNLGFSIFFGPFSQLKLNNHGVSNCVKTLISLTETHMNLTSGVRLNVKEIVESIDKVQEQVEINGAQLKSWNED